jgi:hypothetical protein
MTMTTAQTGEGRKVKRGQKYKDEEGGPSRWCVAEDSGYKSGKCTMKVGTSVSRSS